MTVATHAAASLERGGFDDAYITYTFARNLAEGHGLVWTPGARPLYGTTALPYTFLLALGAAAGLPIPRLSMLVGALGWGAACAVLFALLAPSEGRVRAFLAVLLSAVSVRALNTSLGMETGLYVLLAFAAFHLYAGGRWAWASATAALAALMRLDGLLVPALITLHCFATAAPHLGRARAALRVLAPLLAILLPWGIGLALYFGSVVPHTLRAKKLFELPSAAQFHPSGLWPLFARGPEGPAGAVVLLVVAAAWLLRAAWQWRDPRSLPFLWAVAYVLLFTSQGLPAAPWYYAPLIPILHASFGLGAFWLADRLASRSGPWLRARLVAAGLVGAFVFLAGRSTWQQIRADPWGRIAYELEEHKQLAQRVRADMQARHAVRADVLAFEVGYLGYMVPGQVLDLLGLVSPEVVARGARQGPAHLLEARRPQYAVLVDAVDYPPVTTVYQGREFQRNYREIYSRPTGGAPSYKVFRRHEGRWRTIWRADFPGGLELTTQRPVRVAAREGPSFQDGLLCLDTVGDRPGRLDVALDLGRGLDRRNRLRLWLDGAEQGMCGRPAYGGRLAGLEASLPGGGRTASLLGAELLVADPPSPPLGRRVLGCLRDPTDTVAAVGPFSVDSGLDNLDPAPGFLGAHPPSGLVFEVRNRNQPVRVRFRCAFNPDVPRERTDGVRFRLYEGEAEAPLFARHVRPADSYALESVPLPGAAGQPAVRVALVTDAGPRGDQGWDWARWEALSFLVGRQVVSLQDGCGP